MTINVSFKIYSIPGDWVRALLKKKINIPIHNYFVDDDLMSCTEDHAIEICQKYLQITDKNWWPTLLGKHEIMDRVLNEEFKK